MKHLLRPLALAALAAVLCSSAASAQSGLFGLIPNENPANAPSAYVLRVKQELTTLIGTYKRAWDRDNAEAAAALYTRDGRVVIEGQEAQSREAIQQRLAQVLPAAGQLHFSVMDFDTSGEMAFVSGQMSYGNGDQPGQSMDYVLVARRGRGDQWLIRSLLLTPAITPPAPASAASAPAPATPRGASGAH
ncbi:MAG TPA: nuclear transport factor 2 family protein [Longimicrobium sp.]|nr:nuclear transport factor 2 family protein [Longimicrobium sp.]